MKLLLGNTLIFTLLLAAAMLVSRPNLALAQCGGGSGNMGYMHDQHMDSSGSTMMDNGQMGMYGSQAPMQMEGNHGNMDYMTMPMNQNAANPNQMVQVGNMGNMGMSHHQGQPPAGTWGPGAASH